MIHSSPLSLGVQNPNILNNIQEEMNLNAIPQEFPDFVKFFKENDIKKYIEFFDHKIRLDEKNKQPLILLENEIISWSEAKLRIFGPNEPESLMLPHGWKYNEKGFVQKNLIKWETLEPDWHDKIDPQPGHFFVELVSKKKGWGGFSRHCSLRLIDEQTGVTSVGFCGKNFKWLPFRGQKGKFASPDPGEFVSGKEYRTRIEITANEFLKLKTRIENDQKNKNVYFNFVSRNCSTYCCEVLSEIGININNCEFPGQALWRKVFSKLKIRPYPAVVKAFHCISMFFRYLFSPIHNLGIFLLGGTFANKDIRVIERAEGEKWPKKPNKPFKDVASFFNCSNFKFATGWKVTTWQYAVGKYRAENILKIQEEIHQKELIRSLTEAERKQYDDILFQAKYGLAENLKDTPLGFA